MNKKAIKHSVLALLAMLFLYACGNKPLYESYVEIKNAEWNKDSIASFKLNVADTNTFYNFFLHLRNNNDYAYSNFYTFLTITFPNNKFGKDTLNLPLADLKGKWLGNGIGEIKSSRFLFKEKLQFPLTGEYTFSIQQGMRKDNLIGITDVGLEILASE